MKSILALRLTCTELESSTSSAKGYMIHSWNFAAHIAEVNCYAILHEQHYLLLMKFIFRIVSCSCEKSSAFQVLSV
jgi:hypothetical protein